MRSFLVHHFEKIILAAVVVICLLMIVGSVRQYMSTRGEELDVNELKTKIRNYIDTPAEPSLPPIRKYVEQLASRIGGKEVILLGEVRQGMIYPPELPELIKVMQKPRFAFLPPEPAEITVVPGMGENQETGKEKPKGAAAGYNLVVVSFRTREGQQVEVVNSFPNDYKGHRARVFGAVLQRRLVHDGKKKVSSPWLTLTGDESKPAWEELEDPATSSYILRPERPGEKGSPFRFSPRGEGPPEMMRKEGMTEPFPPPRVSGAAQKKEEPLFFSYEDADVDAFKTYEYRFALVAAIQEGVRLFKRPLTDEDRKKDMQAVYSFNPALYEQGIRFTDGRPGDPEILKKYGIGTDGGKDFKEGKKNKHAPFYLVLSDFSESVAATPKNDCEIFLAGKLGKHVSIYILKHFRYTVEENLAGVSSGGGPLGSGKGGEVTPVLKLTVWAEILMNFGHSVNDRIGKKKVVPGRYFVDNKRRVVDFTTPYRILRVGNADYKEKRIVTRREATPEGEIVEKNEVRERIIRDLLYMDVENVITGKVTRYWRRRSAAIFVQLRREAAQRRKRELDRRKEKEKITRKRRGEEESPPPGEEGAPPPMTEEEMRAIRAPRGIRY